ncbi:enhanced serine sensitivity protein SseB C-terminal domain-containing protein [Peterkaempfera bronchialis]|uniref:enhanced serine sensitivity protein SseB C-terminal domain-containing protein n=1 Tax=Peterkaempfera bronchialis TaxID=2126346 RepID=UPI003C2D0666
MSAGAAGGGAHGQWTPGAPGPVERALREVAPGRYDAYEALLHAIADGQLWMLLWQGSPGSPDAQYGNMEVGGDGYVPCVTSPEQLAASGWTRAHEQISGRDIATALYRDRWGLWLDPHAPGGGVGVPWADLRRIAAGLDRLPAGPLALSEPQVQAPHYYALLTQQAYTTPVVRALRRAWVRPVIGEPYLAIGLDLYDTGPQAVEAVRVMMQRSIAVAPEGLAVSTVAMADEYDPVAMWMAAYARPFFDRELMAGGPQSAVPQQPGPPPGYGYPQQGRQYGYPPPGYPPPPQWPGYPPPR